MLSKLRDATIPCKMCREPLRPGAIKCGKCGAFQSRWRRLLSAPNLGLAVAVVAATSVWWGPALKDFQAPKGAVLKTAFGGTYGPAIRVSVTNTGTMPGALHTMSYAYGDDKNLASWTLRIQNEQLVIESGKTVVVTATLPIGPLGPPHPELSKRCAVETFLTGSNNELIAHRDWFECILVIPAINEARRLANELNVK